MIAVALGTGLRFGELIALSWEDVDFKTGELTIRQAYAKGRARQHEKQPHPAYSHVRFGPRNSLPHEQKRRSCFS